MMNRKMIKPAAFALLSFLALSATAHADDTASGVASDVGAVQKDNSAINSTSSAIAKDRASKAANKASGNWVGQATDSVKLGGDHIAHSEKTTEKSADQKILNNDVDSATSTSK